MLLFLGGIQLNAQIGPDDVVQDDGEKPCAHIIVAKQECNKDGTVDITYRISNNTRCDAGAVSIIPDNGLGQSYPIPINGQSVSGAVFTYNNAAPGSTVCVEIILHGKEGRDCCKTKACIKVTDECCKLKSKIYKVGCEPNSYVHLAIGGGTPPYTGPGVGNGLGEFWVLGLPAGTHVLTYTDSVGCTIDVEVTIQSEKCCGFAAEVTTLGECDGTTVITVTGGTPGYSGPGWQAAQGVFVFLGGIPSGTHTYTYTDANGCEVDVTFTIPECCDIKAEILYTKGCPPDGIASIHVTGGTPPYSGPGTQNALGYFYVTGLSAGDHDLTYTDANDCKVTVTVTIEPCCDQFEGEVVAQGGCAPDAWVRIWLTGGTAPFTGPGSPFGVPNNWVITGLGSGPGIAIYTDANGCVDTVNYVVPVNNLSVSLTNSSGCGSNGFAQFTVTGGTAPYTSGTQTSNNGNFAFFNLSSGTHTFTFTDANGCSVEGSVTIASTTLNASVTSLINATCTQNGSVTIEVFGGNPPYTTNSQAQNVFLNYWEATNLTPGDYTYTFFDSNNCATQVSFTIGLSSNGASCDEFSQISADEDNDAPITIVSGVHATLSVHLEAWCVPDQVIITVNGNQVVDLNAGSSACNGDADCNGDTSQACDQFCVEPCDVVVFTFFSDICGANDDCGNPPTLWDFTVTCTDGCGGGGSSQPVVNIDSRSISNSEEYNPELMALNEIMVFPNPVLDILTVSYSGPIGEYQTARIYNSAGSVLYTEKMNGKDQLQIDASAFPQGIYMIELTDDFGNRVIEKFSKMD